MTTITTPRALLEHVQEFLHRVTHWRGCNHEGVTDLHDMKEAVKAALDQEPATAPKASTFIRERAQLEQEWCALNGTQQQYKNLPAWHDAPDVAMLKAELDAAMKDAERYRWLAAHTRRTSEHWGGRWSIVIDGPVPKRHDCEDAFDEAIDAAIAKAEGRPE